MTKEQIDQYNTLETAKVELTTELQRIEGFLARDPQNKDNERAINQGKIFVKFAGTACMLPTGIFTGALNQRKAEIQQELVSIENAMNSL